MILEYKNITYKDFGELVYQNPVVIIPNSPMEAHGPHLPLGTDIIQAEHMSRVIAEEGEKLFPDVPWLIYPAVPLGADPVQLKGSIHNDYHSLCSVLKNIAGSMINSGIKNIIFTNFHGGARHILAQDMACDYANKMGGKAFAPFGIIFSDFLSGKTNDLLREILGTHEVLDILDCDIHAGALETSLIMAIGKNNVEGHESLQTKDFNTEGGEVASFLSGLKNKVNIFSPDLQKVFNDIELLFKTSAHFRKYPYSGNPSYASKELGDILLELFRKRYVEMLVEFFEVKDTRGEHWKSFYWKNRKIMNDRTFNMVFEQVWGN